MGLRVSALAHEGGVVDFAKIREAIYVQVYA
jgi:hypothetical protein